jgi:hypothetical protein
MLQWVEACPQSKPVYSRQDRFYRLETSKGTSLCWRISDDAPYLGFSTLRYLTPTSCQVVTSGAILKSRTDWRFAGFIMGPPILGFWR